MESAGHQALKHAARGWLLEVAGCAAAAAEVRCPLSRYIVDGAGYLDALPRRGSGRAWGPSPAAFRGDTSRTIIIECKASRADYLSDSSLRSELLTRRRRTCEQLAVIREQFVHELEPHLQASGNLLFADMERWEYGASTLHAHRTLVRQLRRIDQQLHGSTKFFLLAQYRLASMLYLLAPAGLLSPTEVPAGWGLLEVTENEIRTTVHAPIVDSPEPRRQRLLRNIAAALTRRADAHGRGVEGKAPRPEPARTQAPSPAPTGT